MRTVIIRFWGDADHPQELGRVTYDGTGPAHVAGDMTARLLAGVVDLRGKYPVKRRPEEGDAFLDAVLFEFRGGYTRAEELDA